MRRRTVRARLIVTMVAILLLAIAGTYVAATQLTIARVEDLVVAAEDDAFLVIDTVGAYLEGDEVLVGDERFEDPTGSDDGLDELLEELTEQTGLRLAVTRLDGRLLADTATLVGLARGQELPPDPIAIDRVLPVELTDADRRSLVEAGRLLVRCLEEEDVAYELVEDDLLELTYPEPLDEAGFAAYDACLLDVARELDGAELVLAEAAFFGDGDLFVDTLLLHIGVGRSPTALDVGVDGRLLALILAIGMAGIAATTFQARRLVSPIEDLTTAATALGQGDLTARVDPRGEDELARLGASFNAMADALERDTRLRRSLTNDVAHELRSPLTTMQGLLGAARDGLVTPDADLLASLGEEASHLQAIVEDLAALAQADAGRLRLQREAVDLDELLEVVVRAHRGAAREQGLELVRTGVAGIAEVDVRRLRQVLDNLLRNALRHTDRGRIEVAASGTPNRVAIAVADTGEGIAADHLPHVFERFYRVDAARSRDRGGTGLGLAVSQGIVIAHGGRLTVSSTVGRGSTFTVDLPRAATEAATSA